MKLKIIKREHKEVETDLELPVYLHFQDELCNDELVKITEKEKITIKHEFYSFKIEVEYKFHVEELNFERFLTTESHFNEVYEEALKHLHDVITKDIIKIAE